MSEYYWDAKVDYLTRSRRLYFHDDYIEFLLTRVLGLTERTHIVDFGRQGVRGKWPGLEHTIRALDDDILRHERLGD
jgi:hypothetical protein